MALEPGAGRLSVSPTNSGRASPVSKKWATRRGEDDAPTKDKAFRRYASGVDRSLSLFDTSLQEWADYIQSLGRLLKSLQAHPSNINVVPSKSIVAKRLAQCLNPTLPSGVHQKALEVYNYIFSMIGKDELSRDLSLYLPGLSSTLSFASLTVREPFLALLETHILKLHPLSLRPALKALILALLPGLEEDTSEDFERTLHLVDGIKSALSSKHHDIGSSKQHSGDEYFWQCFFLASITSNSRRLGALAYLTRNLPRLGAPLRRDSAVVATSSLNSAVLEELTASSEQNADVVTSPEPGLLLRCFAAGLADEQLLIQRGFLDLLVTHLPLHARVLQTRVKQDDLELLLTAACGVVSRRDMSLNRRLWSWLLGPEPSSGVGEGGMESPMSPSGDPMNAYASSRTRYFEECGLQPLTRAILKMIERDHLAPADRSKPFRICLSLMDRWEIGGLVVPEIFLPVIKSVRRYESQAATKGDFNEVLRSASVFFDGVESGLIWGEIVGLMAGAIGPGKVTHADKADKLSLVRFILSHFNVREEEMVTVHAPTTTLAVLAMVEDLETKVNEESAGKVDDLKEISGAALGIALDMIDLIPERAFIPRPSTSHSRSNETESRHLATENSEVLEKIRIFYVQDQGNLDVSPPPFAPSQVCRVLVQKAGNISSQSIDSSISSADVTLTSRLLVTLLTKAPRAECLDVELILHSVHHQLSKSARQPFSAFTSFISLSSTLYARSYITQEQFSSLVDPLVRLAWSYLSASNPKYHVEAVRGLWQLQTSVSVSNREIEAAICNLITEHDTNGTFAIRDADPGRRFSILWTHTLQDNSGHLDRRGSKDDATTNNRASGVGNYEIMLGRPLFLLLDSLLDERTQLFVTVRTWLQSLVGIDKLFHLFVAKFAGFNFLQHAKINSSGSPALGASHIFSEDDDLDQCLYYLQKLSNILRWSSDATWTALAQNSISTDTSHKSLYLITGRDGEVTLQEFFVHVCLSAVAGKHDPQQSQLKSRISQLHRTSLALLHQILLNPYAGPLSELELEDGLIERLHLSLDDPDPYIQVSLLDVVFASLKLRNSAYSLRPTSPRIEKRQPTQDTPANRRESLAIDIVDHVPFTLPPPASLVKCLQAGFAAPSSRPVLDSWITFLSECLPFYSNAIFQVLIPLVETLCSQLGTTFENLQATFKNVEATMEGTSAPESTLISLFNGLEQVLARGHERLLRDEAKIPAIRSPDHQQSFFGNMVSGVFTSDTPQARSLTANNRLTVLLSFQDAVRICFTIWSWGGRGLGGVTQDPESTASFNYTSLRMRNRARRLLEHLFAAEALECLETVIEIWQKASMSSNDTKHTVVFDLLHVLDGSSPKHTMPAIFDAIYSRTNPGALEASRKSTLTSTLLDTDLVMFLVEYSRSLEDDTMDEIWTDCMTFLKDILANPFPHRQTLPSLLEFAAILGEKVDNTNFGEQKRMRKELGDLFLRLLTATFTTKPMGFMETTHASSEKNGELEDSFAQRSLNKSDDIVGILSSIAPSFPKILVEPDRIFSAANTISASVIGPTFRSKSFPDNVSKSLLVLLYQLTRLPNTQKSWKRDVGDAFNDARFFSNPFALLQSDWLPLLRQWALSDKERMPEMLSRISPPTTAGIVFGVGATSARFESDRKTQLNLRRVATLILAASDDAFVSDLTGIDEKIVELLSATTTSSPSSTTRAEIYMVIRALTLKTSSVHLAPLWPIINAELHASLSSVIAPDHSQSSDTYNNFSILQACKLLDTLLCIAPDDFQLHEWLFITDTIDAVYRPSDYEPVGLIDELSEELGSTAIASAAYMELITAATGTADKLVRRPLLGIGGVQCDDVGLERKDELVGKVLRPFFSQLSIFAFERTYEMGVTDLEACRKDLLKDLFDERGIVKAL